MWLMTTMHLQASAQILGPRSPLNPNTPDCHLPSELRRLFEKGAVVDGWLEKFVQLEKKQTNEFYALDQSWPTLVLKSLSLFSSSPWTG